MSLLDKSLKRRDFLKGTAAAAAATAAFGLSGCSTGTAQDAGSDVAHVVASDTSILADAGEWMPIHCHQNCNQMCLNMGYVVDGVVVRQK
ncbi:MAG: twin-arginine translocation signal domain-containing protein, partial [Eggerthella lenta]